MTWTGTAQPSANWSASPSAVLSVGIFDPTYFSAAYFDCGTWADIPQSTPAWSAPQAPSGTWTPCPCPAAQWTTASNPSGSWTAIPIPPANWQEA